MTLRDWCRNLVEHWDDAAIEVSLPVAKVWGLDVAASRVAPPSRSHQPVGAPG